MKIAVHVSIGLAGCKRERIIDVDDDASDDEIEEIAKEAMFEIVQWGWSPVSDRKASK